MTLMQEAMRAEIEDLIQNQVRVRISGRLNQLPQGTRDEFASAMERTTDFPGMTFNLAINYGGRAEVVDAVKTLARKAAAGELNPEAIDEAAIAAHLYAPKFLIPTC